MSQIPGTTPAVPTMGQPVIFWRSQSGESIRMMGLVHWPIGAASGVWSPTSCLKKYSRTTMAYSQSTPSSNAIGHRTSLHLETRTASACLAERHGPAMLSICFRRKLGSGDFSPMRDIPARTVNSAAHEKNLNSARTMSLLVTMRASRRTGGPAISATAAPLMRRT